MKFPTQQNREFFCKNREFVRKSKEYEPDMVHKFPDDIFGRDRCLPQCDLQLATKQARRPRQTFRLYAGSQTGDGHSANAFSLNALSPPANWPCRFALEAIRNCCISIVARCKGRMARQWVFPM